MNKTYLLTGSVGFLGSFLSLELIKNGHRVIFLGRSKNGIPFRQRAKEALAQLDLATPTENIETLEIDLQKDCLGIKDPNQLGKIDGIWHLAADLSFREEDKEKVFGTNIGGTKNVLKLAEKIKAPVYYVSTSYVHGQRPGQILEDELIEPKKFNNFYEESKFHAEKIVQDWGRMNDKNNFIIFRPSILIDSSGKTANLFGYYAMVYSLYKLKKMAKDRKIKIPFLYSKNTFLNLMPVDVVAKWMNKISNNPDSIGKTFHITNPSPFSIKTVAEQTFGPIGIKIFLFRAPLFLVKFYFWYFCFMGSLIPGFKKMAKRISYYNYYMAGCNTYDMKNTKDILGEEEVENFKLEPNFVQKRAEHFIKKLENNK